MLKPPPGGQLVLSSIQRLLERRRIPIVGLKRFFISKTIQPEVNYLPFQKDKVCSDSDIKYNENDGVISEKEQFPKLTSSEYEAFINASKAIESHQDPSSRFLLGFTCTVCSKRHYKSISKVAYKSGLILVECDGCKNRHLIKDNIGWFKYS